MSKSKHGVVRVSERNTSSYLAHPTTSRVSRLTHPFRFVALFIISCMIGFVAVASGIATHQQHQQAQAFDWNQWVMCDVMPDPGNKIYQWTQSDDLPFMLRSKSAVTGSNDDVTTGLNWILDLFGPGFKKVNESITGYSTDALKASTPASTDSNASTTDEKKKKDLSANYNKGVKVNPFDRFGVAGMKFTAYTGEWKYVVIDACDSKTEPVDPKAGVYYDNRLEPQSTWSDIANSKDIRTQQFSKGFVSQFGMAVGDIIANGVFDITKAIVVLTIGLISFSFSDIVSVMGLNGLIGGSKGVFSSLFTGLFMPLVAIIFALTGVKIFWDAVAKKKYRESMGNLFRSLILFVIAIVIAAKPLLFITIPNGIAVNIQALVLTAMSGKLVGGDDMCSTDVGRISKNTVTNANTNNPQDILNQTTEAMRSTVACSFWQTFLLRPWSQGQFGQDWNELWAKGKQPSWADKSTATTLNNDNAAMVGDATVPVGGGKVLNNWALYQLSTQTNVHSPTGHEGDLPKITSGVANDWWRIVDAMANYQETQKKLTVNAASGGGGSNNEGGGESISGKESDKWVAPLSAPVSSGFGPRNLSASPFHYGADFGAACNTTISSVSDGTVTAVTRDANGANVVLVKNTKDNTDALYVHMADGSVVVKQGQSVKAGDKIGGVGQTGLSFGCHLHLEIRHPATNLWYSFDKSIDPIGYLKSKGVKIDAPSSTAPNDHSDTGDGDMTSTQTITTQENTYNIPKDTTPAREWDDWTGDNMGGRMWAAASSILIAGVGLAAPLFFSALTTVYAFGTALVVAFAPIFLLLGCWPGRGWEIFKGWAQLLLNLVGKRIATGILLALSVSLTLAVINMTTAAEWWKSVLILIMLSLILFRTRKKFISALAGFRFASADLTGTADRLAGHLKKATVGSAKFTGKVALAGAAGGVSSKAGGGSLSSGLVSGARNELKNFTFTDKAGLLGREFRTGYDTMKADIDPKNPTGAGSDFDLNGTCVSCGNLLTPDKSANGASVFVGGRDSSGNLICQECLESGTVPGAREVIFDRPPVQATNKRQRDRLDTKRRADAYRKQGAMGTAAANKFNQGLAEGIIEGRDENGQELNRAQREYKLRLLTQHASVDINNYRRARSTRGVIETPKVPDEIAPYVDADALHMAWQTEKYDYIRMTYVAAYVAWYQDVTDTQFETTLDSLLANLRKFEGDVGKAAKETTDESKRDNNA